MPQAAPTVWIDVEDLLQYADAHARPSGIQRLAFETCRALVGCDGGAGRVRFVRHRVGQGTFRAVPWQDLLGAFETMGTLARPAAAPRDEAPPSVWAELQRAAGLQWRAIRAFGVLLRRLLGMSGGGDAPPPESFAAAVRPGDMVLAVGSPWFPGYVERVARAQAEHGVRFAMIVYDIIPLLYPEWCAEIVTAAFEPWMRGLLPLSDRIFSISRSTAEDVQAYAARHGIVLRTRPQPIPIGTGFGPPVPLPPVPPPLPPGSYVLFVSTLEPRKNHLLLLRVWRRLLEEMPTDDVPTLVFAGRVGWMVQDLVTQLDNCDWLGGKIMLREGPSDAELHALYQGCLFTVFPSLYEGWGLPVTESLAEGKPCMISTSSSLPEAGGALARYFDPESVADATRALRATLQDRGGLAAWQAQVAREFRPVAWDETARAVLHGLA